MFGLSGEKELKEIGSFSEVQGLIVKCPVWEEKRLEKLLKKGLPLIKNVQDGMLIIEKARKDSEVRIEAICKTVNAASCETEYNDTIMAISWMIN